MKLICKYLSLFPVFSTLWRDSGQFFSPDDAVEISATFDFATHLT